MSSVQSLPLPTNSLLVRYPNSGAYTDCFAIDVPRTVSHAEFVEAFYTGRLFKLERFLLRVFLSKPSTDDEARQLALGELNEFAVWRVEARAEDQLLMCAMDGHTRSWLMVSAADAPNYTRLYCGSAVVTRMNRSTGQREMGWIFRALLPLHTTYSRALLRAAARRVLA